MSKISRYVVKAAVAAGVIGIAAPHVLAATLAADKGANDLLVSLSGRWVGKAVMITMSGPQANFKCIVTYLPSEGGAGLNQNLRCESGDFKLHAATQLIFDGDKVTGRWQDKINEVDGTVLGAMTPTGFEVQLSGKYFAAKMAVAGSACDQSVKVMPTKSDVFRELAAELKKC